MTSKVSQLYASVALTGSSPPATKFIKLLYEQVNILVYHVLLVP